MKNTIAYFIFALCIPLFSVAQGISGQGDVVKQEIQLANIKGVQLAFSGDIILTQGSPQKIVMEGQQNILDNIKREVKEGVWKVGFEKNVRDIKPVKIYITMSSLEVASVSGSGNITSTNTFQNLGNLEIGVSGSGGVDLSVSAQEIDAAISGSGEIVLKGSANALDVGISGSGDVDAVELRTADCEVAISGSGDAQINCTGSLDSKISGSGDVRYKGNAPKVKASVSGSGDVREIE